MTKKEGEALGSPWPQCCGESHPPGECDGVKHGEEGNKNLGQKRQKEKWPGLPAKILFEQCKPIPTQRVSVDFLEKRTLGGGRIPPTPFWMWVEDLKELGELPVEVVDYEIRKGWQGAVQAFWSKWPALVQRDPELAVNLKLVVGSRGRSSRCLRIGGQTAREVSKQSTLLFPDPH